MIFNHIQAILFRSRFCFGGRWIEGLVQYPLCIVYTLLRGRFDVAEGIRNVELVPFIHSKGVVREHFNAFDVVQCFEKIAQTVKEFVVVGDAGNQDVADPKGLSDVRQIAGTV